MPIGNVDSTERGSGARYNDGKPDLSLIPPVMLPCHDEGSDHYSLLQAIQFYMFLEHGDRLWAWMDAAMATSTPECARVFEYGKRKYSARGDCTCHGGDKAKRHRAEVLAETNMKSISENQIQSMQSGNAQTDASGMLKMPLVYDSGKRPEVQKLEQSQRTGTELNTEGLSGRTISLESSMTRCSVLAVRSAEASTGRMLTTATQPAELEEYFAIPATSALDFSKGLTAGLSEHSPTCGVHKVRGGAWNWAKGMNWSIPIACTLRHAHALYYEGEVCDRESGLPHIGHILCNLVMLRHFAHTFPEGNDLPYKVLSHA